MTSPHQSRYWPVISALWLAEIAGSFETAMIYAALNRLIAHLGDPLKVGWLVTVYLLVGAGAATLVGRIGDLYGRRRVILILLACGIIGSLISALSTNYPMLLGGRALQGLCGAILPLTIGLVRENLPPTRISPGIGLLISGASAGTAAGLVIGGVIVDHFSWHGVFFASAVFSMLAFLAILLWVPVSRRSGHGGRLDWLGGVLFVPAILLLLSAITYAPQWGWLAPSTLVLAASGIMVLLLWARASLHAADPLFDVRLFADRAVLVANLVTALVAFGALQITLVFSTLLQAPTWTMVGLGASATIAGLAKLPSNICALFAGPLSGWLTERRGGRVAMLAGGALTTMGWLAALAFHDSVPAVMIVLCVIAFGTTILFAVGPTILALTVPPDRTSEAAGMMTVVRQAFMGIGAQFVTVLLASSTVAAPGAAAHYPSDSAFRLVMGVIAALSLAATFLAFALPHSARSARTRD